MKHRTRIASVLFIMGIAGTFSNPASANALKEAGKVALVAKTGMSVTPPRAWNSLALRPSKNAEIWTLDGEQLNKVTFFAGIASGVPLYKERNKKRESLPKMRADTLLVDIPELLEGTIRGYNNVAIFEVTNSMSAKFLGKDAIQFNYTYTDNDQLPRLGEAVATIVGGKLYMVTFEAPRLHYFKRTVEDYRRLVASASLK